MFQYLVFPFALHHEAVDLGRVSDRWVGSVQAGQAGLYIDVCCLLIMGGLPWQVRGLAPHTHTHTHPQRAHTEGPMAMDLFSYIGPIYTLVHGRDC